MHIKHHYAATTLAVVFLVAMVALVASKYQFANNQVSSTTGVLSTYQNAQNALSNKASTLAQNVSTLSSKLTSSNATIQADANEIASLQSELSAAESKVSSLSTDAAAISSMNASLQMYKSFYTSQISTISAQLTQIASLNSKVSSLNNQLSKIDNTFLSFKQLYPYNLTLPPSYSLNTSTTNWAALGGTAWNGSDFLLVGGGANISNVYRPLIGSYNPYTNNFTNLAPEFTSSSANYSNLFPEGVAYNGSGYLIFSTTPNGATQLVYYHGSTFTNLTSLVPAGLFSGSQGFGYQVGVSWDGNSFVILNNNNNGHPAIELFANNKFTNVTVPAVYDAYTFMDVACTGTSECLILASNLTASQNNGESPLYLIPYYPSNNSLGNVVSPSNQSVWYGNGGLTNIGGSNYLVVSAQPGGYDIGLFNASSDGYTPIPIASAAGIPYMPAWDGNALLIPTLIYGPHPYPVVTLYST